jgi:hypothetical protein
LATQLVGGFFRFPIQQIQVEAAVVRLFSLSLHWLASTVFIICIDPAEEHAARSLKIPPNSTAPLHDIASMRQESSIEPEHAMR